MLAIALHKYFSIHLSFMDCVFTNIFSISGFIPQAWMSFIQYIPAHKYSKASYKIKESKFTCMCMQGNFVPLENCSDAPIIS